MENNELQRLVDDQHGVVTYPQLRPHGYSRKRVQHAIEAGHWQQVLFGVYSMFSGPLGRDAVLTSALLYGGGSSILSNRTAAEDWYMLPVDDASPVHITVPYGASAVSVPPTPRRPTKRLSVGEGGVVHPGVIVHRSRAMEHVRVGSSLPRTSKVDTAIDVAVSETTPERAFATLIALATDGGIRIADLAARIEQRKPRRYNTAIADALRLLADGVQSVLEFRYAIDVEQAHGLPNARRQGPVVVDGQTLYEDVLYSLPGKDLIVRLDGRATHTMRGIPFRDRRRENAAEVAGKSSLVYGWEEVHGEACEVGAEVRYVLERLGWTGPNPCPNCARNLPLTG
jgi:hypothetical protein